MDQLGPNALGEALEPGRVADCYLGLLLPPGPAGEPEAGTVLVVAPAALLHPRVPQPAGSLIYELLTGHPERQAGELVFLADLTGELRAWPNDTWAKLGVDPDQVAKAIIGCWQDGEVTGFQVDDLNFEQARSLTRPAMTYVRGQLRGRLIARLARVHQRWLHPTSGRQPGRPVPVATAPAGRTPDTAVYPRVRNLDGMAEGRSGSVRWCLRQNRSCSRYWRRRWSCRPDTRPFSPRSKAAVASGSSGSEPASSRTARLAMSAVVAAGITRVHAGGRVR